MKLRNTLIDRRSLLRWSVPTVSAIALPAHAQTSLGCSGAPTLNVVSSPKCAGDPPVGSAEIEVFGPNNSPITIKSMVAETDDSKSDLSNLPVTPFDVIDSVGARFTWTGPASDGASCLPLAQVSLTVEYCCDGSPTSTEVFDITQLLIDSV